MKRATAALRDGLVARTPEPVRRRVGPAASYLHMLVFDHLWIRLVYPNRHKLADGAWRSAQPLPHQIGRLGREGFRTIVNLRGRTKTSTYAIERSACESAGLVMIDFPMKSRGAPSKEVLRAVRELFEKVEKPVLFHCKSGADRAGLVSALFLHYKQGVPIEQAKEQLSIAFGHIRQADTGILDEFLDRYIADNAKSPMPFDQWVDTIYDPAELQAAFQSKGWANRLVRGVLRRE